MITDLEGAIEWERRLAAANAKAAPRGLDEVRVANARMMAERSGELPADVHVRTADACGIPGEWISVGAPGPTILFLHSGGCVVGSAAENREWLGRITRVSGGRALAIDFRLAPEHPWPAQREDAIAAYRWLLEGEGVPPHRIALLGESGGGAVLLSTLLALRGAGDPLPAVAVLTSPLVDMALTAESIDANAGTDPFVSRPGLEEMMQALLQGQDAAAVSPLNADLANLPPLLVQVGTAEAMFDDGRRLAEKAKTAGVDVMFEPWEDMIHLWHGFPGLPQAIEATERLACFIRNHTKERY